MRQRTSAKPSQMGKWVDLDPNQSAQLQQSVRLCVCMSLSLCVYCTCMHDDTTYAICCSRVQPKSTSLRFRYIRSTRNAGPPTPSHMPLVVYPSV